MCSAETVDPNRTWASVVVATRTVPGFVKGEPCGRWACSGPRLVRCHRTDCHAGQHFHRRADESPQERTSGDGATDPANADGGTLWWS